MAAVSAVLAGVGNVFAGFAEAGQLRNQASQVRNEGQRKLAFEQRRLRREEGMQAVQAGSSGLMGGSFAEVFQSQALEDAEFLGSIKQRTQNESDFLKNTARNKIITSVISGGQTAFSGIAGARQNQAAIQSQRDLSRQVNMNNAGGRINPGQNPFGNGRGTGTRGRQAGTATFF